MQKEVAVADLRRERDKMVALRAKLLKDFERQEQFDQEVEEEELAEEAERSRRSARRKAAAKAGAKEAGKTGVAVTPGTTAQDGSGQSNKGELSKIKADQANSSLPKAESMPKEVAKAVRDAKVLARMVKEGE